MSALTRTFSGNYYNWLWTSSPLQKKCLFGKLGLPNAKSDGSQFVKDMNITAVFVSGMFSEMWTQLCGDVVSFHSVVLLALTPKLSRHFDGRWVKLRYSLDKQLVKKAWRVMRGRRVLKPNL